MIKTTQKPVTEMRDINEVCDCGDELCKGWAMTTRFQQQLDARYEFEKGDVT